MTGGTRERADERVAGSLSETVHCPRRSHKTVVSACLPQRRAAQRAVVEALAREGLACRLAPSACRAVEVVPGIVGVACHGGESPDLRAIGARALANVGDVSEDQASGLDGVVAGGDSDDKGPMRVTSTFSRLLDLSGVSVRSVCFAPGCVVVTVALRRRRLVCPKCSYSTRHRENRQKHQSV